MNAPDIRMRELRVGMSVYWVRLVPELGMWHASWTQGGQARDLWCRGTVAETMTEVRLAARKLEPGPVVTP